MKKITITKLKKSLSGKTKKELLEEIADLFAIIPPVQEYYTFALSEKGPELLLNKYKEKVKNEFFPTRGMGKFRLSVAKKAINDFKKISQDPASAIEIMLYYVEQGVEFTDTYGDIDGPFYNSMGNMFENALKLAKKSDLEPSFQKIAKKIVQEACEGWGFQEDLANTYYEFYGTSFM